MRVLIDSAALIWWFADDRRLGPTTADVIEDPSTEAYVSVASAWEIEMKRASDKLRLDGALPECLEAGLMYDLPVRLRHAAIGSVPRGAGQAAALQRGAIRTRKADGGGA